MFSSCKTGTEGQAHSPVWLLDGWGDGEWMRSWETTAKGYGAQLAAGSVICADAPDEGAVCLQIPLGKHWHKIINQKGTRAEEVQTRVLFADVSLY